MRRKRNIDRQAGKLADTNLIVIASEDRYAVKQYFGLFHSAKIQFEVLETEDGASSPVDVLARLDLYRKEFQIGEGDQFWLVTDIDHWAQPGHISNLTDVIQQCKSKGIGVATSHPCFDYWLLLHFEDPPQASFDRCDDVGSLIRASAGAYNKTRVYSLPIAAESVVAAVERARGQNPQAPILQANGTLVYQIVENLIERSLIDIPDQD